MTRARRRPPTSAALLGFIAMISAPGGCVWFTESTAKLPLGVDPSAVPYANSAWYRDTIGSLAYFRGLRGMRARGYGLVVGLGKNGSKGCPRRVHSSLVADLYKQHRFTSEVVGVHNVSPEQMIKDLDTAVVIVEGEIPPAATVGARFDVVVRVLPGTETRSLLGGRLYTADLRMYRAVGPDTTLPGRILARAAGPLFLNPFCEKDSATRSNPLQATILGGGAVVEDRRLQLVLVRPSYHHATRIQNRINAFFAGHGIVADAISPSFVCLRVPGEYRSETGRFLALVRGLFLQESPAFCAQRARELAAELQGADIDSAPRIAVAFETLGAAALPVLNELYAHRRDEVSFHAAVTGLRLGDYLASDALVSHAEDQDCRFRLQAVRALGAAEGIGGAAMCLRRLIRDSDARIQLAAYDELARSGDAVINRVVVGRDNFVLDIVRTEGNSFIYVKRRHERRIALFGPGMRCKPPVLYVSPDGGLTITAKDGDDHLTVLRVVVATGSMSPTVAGPMDLPDLISLMGADAGVDSRGRVTGLGVGYGAVVHALYLLCRQGAVDAEFVLEDPGAAIRLGPDVSRGRPESEL